MLGECALCLNLKEMTEKRACKGHQIMFAQLDTSLPIKVPLGNECRSNVRGLDSNRATHLLSLFKRMDASATSQKSVLLFHYNRILTEKSRVHHHIKKMGKISIVINTLNYLNNLLVFKCYLLVFLPRVCFKVCI